RLVAHRITSAGGAVEKVGRPSYKTRTTVRVVSRADRVWERSVAAGHRRQRRRIRAVVALTPIAWPGCYRLHGKCPSGMIGASRGDHGQSGDDLRHQELRDDEEGARLARPARRRLWLP